MVGTTSQKYFCSHVPPSHPWGPLLMSQGQLIWNWRVPVQYVVYRPVWAGFGWVKGNSPEIDWYGVGMRHRWQLVQLVRHWPKMLLKPSFALFFKAPWSEVWRGFDSSLRCSAFSSYLSFFVLTIKSPTFLSRSALTQYRRVCPNRSIFIERMAMSYTDTSCYNILLCRRLENNNRSWTSYQPLIKEIKRGWGNEKNQDFLNE